MEPELIEYQLSPAVRAFSTTRKGGVGEGAYAAFNITHYCGDIPAHVVQNRELLCQRLGINDHQLFLPRQVHGAEILKVDDDFLKKDTTAQTQDLEGIDAIVTALPGICIGVSTADCVPVLLYDEDKHVAAAIHAGWRGTVAKIVSRTMAYLKKEYGCQPSDIKAVIGPSISLPAFEVGKEVYEEFETAGFPMNAISKFYPVPSGDVQIEGKTGKWHLDLWAANCLLLEDSGVDLSNIQVANICTVASYDTFFSARKMGVKSGRIFNGIMIK